MPKVDWKRFGFAALAVILIGNIANSYFARRDSPQQDVAGRTPVQGPKLNVVASSQSADGVSEEQLSPQFAEALARNAEERMVAKLQAVPKQAEITRPAPRVVSQPVVLSASGRRLVVIRYQIDSTSRAVEIFGVSGLNAYRVMCSRDALEEILITSGPCAEKIKEVFGVNLGG